MQSPLTIIQEQVEAYNSRNINRFADLHHQEVKLFSFGEAKPYLVGRKNVHTYYGAIFENSPDLHAEIVSRITMGNTIIDHEIVSGREGVKKLEIVAIYEVEDGLIKKVTFIRS